MVFENWFDCTLGTKPTDGLFAKRTQDVSDPWQAVLLQVITVIWMKSQLRGAPWKPERLLHLMIRQYEGHQDGEVGGSFRCTGALTETMTGLGPLTVSSNHSLRARKIPWQP